MDIIQKHNSDSILDLPTDKTQPTLAEVKIVNTLFKDKKLGDKSHIEKKFGFKHIIQYVLLIFLIMVFNLDLVKIPELFQKSPLLFNITKAFLIVLIFFIFQIMYI